jgi:hypothetical protein
MITRTYDNYKRVQKGFFSSLTVLKNVSTITYQRPFFFLMWIL